VVTVNTNCTGHTTDNDELGRICMEAVTTYFNISLEVIMKITKISVRILISQVRVSNSGLAE